MVQEPEFWDRDRESPIDATPYKKRILKPQGVGCTLKSCILLFLSSWFIFLVMIAISPRARRPNIYPRSYSSNLFPEVEGELTRKSIVYAKKGYSLKKVGYLTKGTKINGEGHFKWVKISNIQIFDLETHETQNPHELPSELYIKSKNVGEPEVSVYEIMN